MKKVILSFLIIIMCFCADGCSNNESTKEKLAYEKQNTYTLEDLSIYDTETRQYIKLFDNKQNVEKILGENSSKNFDGFLYNKKCINLQYKDEKVIELSLDWADPTFDEKDKSRYEFSFGITEKSTVTDFFEKFPEALEFEYTSYDKVKDKSEVTRYRAVVVLERVENGKYKIREISQNDLDALIEGDFIKLSIFYDDYANIKQAGVTATSYIEFSWLRLIG